MPQTKKKSKLSVIQSMKDLKKGFPLVSVIMPVYNAGNFLIEAIESILNQTFSDFEFIIVDDGSSDNSWEIIQEYADKDKRIKAFRNKRNLGVSPAANLALSKCQGKYIARMDADDISFSERLEKQVKYLSFHPQTIALGGQCVVIDQQGKIIGDKKFPTDANKLSEMIFFAVPIQQPSMIINRSLLPKNFKWYSPNHTSAEEIDLLFRLMKYGQIANLKDWLLFYRFREDSLSHINPKKTFWLTLKSRIKALKMGFNPSLKSLVLNLAQVVVISLLPKKTINVLWYFLRGINKKQALAPLGQLATLR